MIIIETCPECGCDLINTVLTVNPSFQKKECSNPNCKWTWEGQREQIVRVPFNGNESPYVITMDYFQNDPCIKCSANPRNGGSGICNCTLNLPKITC